MGSEGGLASAAEAFLAWCRIEKGLAPQTLSAYGLDIERFNSYWNQLKTEGLPSAGELGAYIDSFYREGYSSRTVARHLTTLRSFYRFLLQEGRTQEDATRFLRAPKQWRNLPKYLTREQVSRLLAEPKLRSGREERDRAMLEVLYASGLRVSELCGVKLSDVNLSLGYLRVTGKGGKTRMVPLGQKAQQAIREYLESARGRLLRDAAVAVPVRDGAWRAADTPGVLEAPGIVQAARGHPTRQLTPHVLRHSFCDAPARRRRRSSQRSGDVGPCRHRHDRNLYARGPPPPEGDSGPPSPARRTPGHLEANER